MRTEKLPTKSTNLFLRTVRRETMRTRGRAAERLAVGAAMKVEIASLIIFSKNCIRKF